MDIMISTLHDKSTGNYEDLSLFYILLDFEVFSFADFVEEILSKENERLNSERIDININKEIVSRWELPFDEFTVTLYRDGFELDKDFSSNYMYIEMNTEDGCGGFENGGFRRFWLDLYYSKEDYNSDDVFRDILREINNFKNRDFKECLKELEDEE